MLYRVTFEFESGAGTSVQASRSYEFADEGVLYAFFDEAMKGPLLIIGEARAAYPVSRLRSIKWMVK